MGWGYKERDVSRNRMVRRVLLAILALIVSMVVLGASVELILNLLEFGELYMRPIYFSLIAGLVLSPIALFRLDFRGRRSLALWLLNLLIAYVRFSGRPDVIARLISFEEFKVPPRRFFMWQLTKTLVGIPFFANAVFGMSVIASLEGWDSGLLNIPRLFVIPFIWPPTEGIFAQENVIPSIPALTLLLPAILGAVTVRLVILFGLTKLVSLITSLMVVYPINYSLLWKGLATVELLVAVGLIWTGFNTFFSSYIDYNTKLAIGFFLASGITFLILYLRDSKKLVTVVTARNVLARMIIIMALAIAFGTGMAIQNSIADPRQPEWRGPYIAQEIAVNRFFADLDEIKEVDYEFGLKPLPPDSIEDYVRTYEGLLYKVRVWDREAAFTKLKPDIGLIPYVEFSDSDIIRFNGSIYWSASMKPVVPQAARLENVWFNEHFVYTHVPNGFLLLDGANGETVDPSSFFSQRRVYYGEGGLFEATWAAYPANRQSSNEVTGYAYSGKGGITVSPPLTWFFDPTFLLSYPDTPIHIIRYRDIHQRMALLFPYFSYSFDGEKLDVIPVTDGSRTYWLVPLIARIDANLVPWSAGNYMLKLVGYAIIDIYDGNMMISVIGDDFFSNLFKVAYKDYVIETLPIWLKDQVRYPREMIRWKMDMYNTYHVTDINTFIQANRFYEIPSETQIYYIIAKPPGFDSPEFIALISVQIRGAEARNLSGYMVVRNDFDKLGEMIFFKVPLGSEVKLLGPSAAFEALEKDPEYRVLKRLLENPREGDRMLYRIGDYDVYFIPIYTAQEVRGDVVAQLAKVAVVGAAWEGPFYVALGDDAKDAFTKFLRLVSGRVEVQERPTVNINSLFERVSSLIAEKGLSVLTPYSISPHVSFLEANLTLTDPENLDSVLNTISVKVDSWMSEYGIKDIMIWIEDDSLMIGIMVNVEGIVRLHFVEVNVGGS